MTVSYRLLVPADQQFLWEMLYLAIFIPEGRDVLPREVINQPELARYVESWGRQGDMGVLAQDEDIPIGAAWLRRMRGYGFVAEEIPELSISILPSYRGIGIGTRMIQAIIEQARKFYPGISLSVNIDNQVIRLYERLGFETVRKDGDTLVMLLNLEYPIAEDK